MSLHSVLPSLCQCHIITGTAHPCSPHRAAARPAYTILKFGFARELMLLIAAKRGGCCRPHSASEQLCCDSAALDVVSLTTLIKTTYAGSLRAARLFLGGVCSMQGSAPHLCWHLWFLMQPTQSPSPPGLIERTVGVAVCQQLHAGICTVTHRGPFMRSIPGFA